MKLNCVLIAGLGRFVKPDEVKPQDGKLYARRDRMELDKAGNYYCHHVSAMTGEQLHSKADIAAELGYRDMLIDTLRNQLKGRRLDGSLIPPEPF